jgi:hypothetical protein
MENKNSGTNQSGKPAGKIKARKVRARAKTPKVTEVQPTLEFAEPDKSGWRYAQGAHGRFCIGASRHHETQFGLYIRTPEMSRFKFLRKFQALSDALAEAEKLNASKPLTVTSNGNG